MGVQGHPGLLVLCGSDAREPCRRCLVQAPSKVVWVLIHFDGCRMHSGSSAAQQRSVGWQTRDTQAACCVAASRGAVVLAGCLLDALCACVMQSITPSY